MHFQPHFPGGEREAEENDELRDILGSKWEELDQSLNAAWSAAARKADLLLLTPMEKWENTLEVLVEELNHAGGRTSALSA